MKKLSLSLLSFILVSIIALGWAMDVLFEEFFLDDFDDPIQHYEVLGEQFAQTLDRVDDPEGFIQNWQQQTTNELSLLERASLPLPAELWSPLENGEALILETEAGLTLYYWLPNQAKLLSFTPNALKGADEVPMVNIALTTGFYIGLLGLLILWLLPLMTSLRTLRKNALAYGEGDFSTRIPARRITYLDDIENTFNRMADQIETLIQDNKLISSAVSHDLRTPLARLRFGIDMLSETQDPNEREKYQEHLSNDIDEMQSLVEALLNYARLEQTLVRLDRHPVDLFSILQDYQENHPREVVDLESLENLSLANTTVLGHATYLKMLMHNILNNALNYGDQKILITLSTNKESLSVHIHDDGKGIPAEKRDTLFKPFIRGETEDQPSGYGMGLAIAERIAHWHSGSIKIKDSSRLKGAEFQITLPLAQPNRR